MSDDILNDGPNRYYYIGTDKFLFGGGSTDLPLEDALSEDFYSPEESGDSLLRIARKMVIVREERIGALVSKSVVLNQVCRALLNGIENNLALGARAGGMEHRQGSPQSSLGGVSVFPHGSKITQEVWNRLLFLAQKRLKSHGYLITQRDKKYLTEKSGVFVTPYMWSTLVERMKLRRVKNPYSASALVIYVPSPLR